jgi:ribosomal protein L24E
MTKKEKCEFCGKPIGDEWVSGLFTGLTFCDKKCADAWHEKVNSPNAKIRKKGD